MDIGTFEKVQARTTKIPRSMRNLGYETRQRRWGIYRQQDSL